MKKSIKKIFAVTFFVAMFLCLTALFASAETWKYNGNNLEIQVEGDFQYVLIEQKMLNENDLERGPGAAIVKYTGTSASVAIPSTLGGQPVVWITNGAFKGNTALQTVTIGESVKCIVAESFANCTGLQTVLIAKNVDSLGNNAFSGCSALKSVTFQKGSKLVSIGYDAFENCTSLNNFTIPETVETIGDWAFYNCDSMTSIVIPDSVTYLGAGAFYHCASLVDVKIGNGVPVLATSKRVWNANNWGVKDDEREGCFEGCISLVSVTIGSSVETIDMDCFAGTALITLYVPANVKTIGDGAFMNCSSLKTAEIVGGGTTTVGGSAFRNDSALTKIVFGDGVTSIGGSVLRNCDALIDIQIGENLISIGSCAFWDCDGLISVTIPTNVITLGAGAFFHCDNLANAVIGNGVTEFATSNDTWNASNWGSNNVKCEGTFEGCVNLKTISIGSAVKSIGYDCFAGTGLEKVYIPDNVITISTAAFMNCPKLTDIEIGNGVTSMGDSVLKNCDALVNVIIGKGVVTIGKCAFWDCDVLKEIYIPSNVTTLGAGSFYHCNLLEKAVIGNGVTALSTSNAVWNGSNWGIKDDECEGCFEGCINLKDVTLGSGIISIGTDTFAGTQITTLTIPGKVSTISSGAFAGATQLKDIYFTGNWAASVGDSIFNNIADGYTVHYIANKIGYDDLAYNKATFTPVTVTFDNNSDDVFAAPTEAQILAPVGGYVIEPINPTAFGYHFVGWYKDAECTQKWDFANDNVTEDTTLYAKWNSVDDVVPLRPENIETSEKDGSSITLKWSAVDGATGYNVYVDGVKHNDSTIFTTEYKVDKLSSSTTYEFVVRAVNSKGESPDSLIYADRTNDHVHEYGEWTVTKEATCSAEGEQSRTCECGSVEKEAIPATGIHAYGEWFVTLEPTCVTDGEKSSECADCGDVKTETVPATNEHIYGEWKVTKEATCTVDGEQEHTCSICGDTETEVINAAGEHTFGEWVIVDEATETSAGLREHTCTVCGAVEAEEIPMLAPHEHVFGEWVIVEEATETSAGLREHSCTVCGAVEAEEIPMLTPQPAGIKGDVNGDGRVTAADARLVLRAAAKIETFTDEVAALAEVTGDGKVTAADARKILRVAAKVDEF